MKKKAIATVVVSALIMAGCTPAQASSESTARMGESVEVDGVKATIREATGDCVQLKIENTRWLRSIKPDEGGVVRGYAGVQDSILYLGEGEDASPTSDYNWGDLAPIKRGQIRDVLLCHDTGFSLPRVQIDISDSTVEFS